MGDRAVRPGPRRWGGVLRPAPFRKSAELQQAFERALAAGRAAFPRARVEGIARYYQVHRTTVTRWIQQARSALVANTRQLLTQRLRVSGRELESLVWSLGSRLDFSISQILIPPERSRPPS